MALPQQTDPTYAPLQAQRRGRRERSLAAAYHDHSGHAREARADVASAPLGEPAAPSSAQAASSTWRWLGRLLPRGVAAIHPQAPGRAGAAPARPVPGSAAAEAALAQFLTGSGSGPYSGTPFRPAPGTAQAAGGGREPTATDPCDTMRHDHGIIDHSRHASSLGRR
jgi:hypothetical protein